MSLTEKISMKATNFVGSYCNLENQELQKVKYGIEIFVMNIYKIFVVFFIAWLLNILPHTVLFMLSYGLVRGFAFGIHAKSGLSCLFWTTLIFLGLAYISPHVPLNLIFINLIFAFNIASAILFAPADTEKRPIVNTTKRKVLKIKTITSLILLYIIAIFYSNPTCANIITFSTLVACLIINPLLYKVLGQKYNNYKTYVKKEA